jgi:hypothetical protein
VKQNQYHRLNSLSLQLAEAQDNLQDSITSYMDSEALEHAAAVVADADEVIALAKKVRGLAHG